MSTKVKENLHELIKYLSKSEKRYFKLYASRHTIGDENNYIILFDYLEKQEEYKEEAIFKHFKGQAFLNKFSITKKRLYDQILHALDSFYANSSVDAQIYRLIHSADILYNKSLYEHSRRQLRSAEKLAQKHDRYNLLAEISLKQKKLAESKSTLTLEEIENILQNDLQNHEQSLAFDKLWNMKSRLFYILNSKGITRSREELSPLDDIMKEVKLFFPSEKLNDDARYLYNHINSAYYYAVADWASSYDYLQQNIQLFESKKESIAAHPNRYFSVLTNAIFLANKLKKSSDAHALLKKLKSLETDNSFQQNEDLHIKLFSSINSLELTLLMLKGEFQEAIRLIPVIENGMMLYEDKLTASRKAFLDFKIGTVFFALNDWSSALKWMNRILNDPSIDSQEDLLSFAHIMSLLIHVEMKNETLLPYALRNTQRFLKSRNRLYSFESLFLKYINRLIKTTDYFDQEMVYQSLLEDLQKVKESEFDHLALEYFHFIAWAESKVKRIPFQEVLKTYH